MFRPVLRQRAAVSGAVLMAGGVALYPRQTAFAEAPPSSKKPIYDDDSNDDLALLQKLRENTQPPPASQSQAAPDAAPASLSPTTSSSQSPTDQLANQIRHVRLFLYDRSLSAENAFNNTLSRVLHAESRFTNTVASLAPARESGERLLPGSIYVIVSAMAGSIVSRNRGIVLRAATPLTAGTIAAWTLLPVTMRNVSDLVWEYEKKVPALAENHIKIRDAADQSWRRAVAHSQYGRVWLEDKIGEGRETLEKWISKGK